MSGLMGPSRDHGGGISELTLGDLMGYMGHPNVKEQDDGIPKGTH